MTVTPTATASYIERSLILFAQGTRLEGEDRFVRADGSPLGMAEDEFAVRFHLHPTVKATRLTDGHGVMLMMPNKEIWTFSAHDHHVDLEDSVYLAGSEGPRKTMQMVIHGNDRTASRVSWSFQQAAASAAANGGTTRRVREEEPRLPL